jgi:hypothetical protein
MPDKPTVDAYVTNLEPWQREIVDGLRTIIRTGAPDATESIKWAQPVYDVGGPFAYIKPFPNSVNIGFLRGAELDDPKGILEGGGDRMRHHTVHRGDEIPAPDLERLVRDAAALNRQNGDPTRRRG